MDRPNLFDFPPGEFPEGAFVCWLLSWADPGHRPADAAQHALASALLGKLLELGRVAVPTALCSVQVRRPFQPAADLVLVNDDLALLLDGKADTRDNLARPQQLLDAVRREYPARQTAAVLLQLADQSSGGPAQQAGFGCLTRGDLLELLGRADALGVRSDIVGDFRRHLRKINEAAAGYRRCPPCEWGRDRERWGGFFAALREQLGEGEWGPVTNAGGGLMAFWWHWADDRYLQLELAQLCFKVKVKDPVRRTGRWRDWHRALMAAASTSELRVRRPLRRRSSAWMTVAVLEDDYRQVNADGALDLDATVKLLRQAERLQDAAVTQAAMPPSRLGE